MYAGIVRTYSVVYLGPARYHTGNIFMSLETGKVFVSGVHATFMETELP